MVLLPEEILKEIEKMAVCIHGPYTVVDRLTDVTYLIKRRPQDKGTVVHVDKLKLCVEIPDDHGVIVNAVLVSESPMEQSQGKKQCDICRKCSPGRLDYGSIKNRFI